jgi:hypothetical protein
MATATEAPWDLFDDDASGTAAAPSPPTSAPSATPTASVPVTQTTAPVSLDIKTAALLNNFLRDHSSSTLSDLKTIQATLDASQGAIAESIRKRLGELAIMARLGQASQQPQRMLEAADSLVDLTFTWLQVGTAGTAVNWIIEGPIATCLVLQSSGGWPHVCLREGYGFGQAARAALLAATRPQEAMAAADMALVMGVPYDQLRGLVHIIEPAAMAAAAAVRGRNGQDSSDPASALVEDKGRLPTVPAVLGPDVPEAVFPRLNRDNAIARAATLSSVSAGARAGAPKTSSAGSSSSHRHASDGVGSGGGGDGGGVEHPLLQAARALTEAAPLRVADFRKQYVQRGRPVVLAGAAAGWPALARWRDLQHLADAYGHRTVPVELGQHLSGHW